MKLKTNTLYIMSGSPGSGKSTFLQRNIKEGNISKEMVISSDSFRDILVSSHPCYKEGKLSLNRSADLDEAAFGMLKIAVEGKIREGLTTFVDMTSINDEVRIYWVDLAKKYNFDYEVLILDTTEEEVIKRNKSRKNQIKHTKVTEWNRRFQKDSKFNHRVISSNDSIELDYRFRIDHNKVDVIGDIHGVFDDMIELLEKLGYVVDNDKISHPDDRKLLFAGDILDRGLESVKVIKFVQNAVRQGHYAIKGNHEVKQLRIQKMFDKKMFDKVKGSSAVMRTFMDINTDKKRDELLNFLDSLPNYYIVNNEYVVVHAHLEYFGMNTTYSQMNYGSQEDTENADLNYDRLYKDGINKFKLIRGHILPIHGYESKNVIVLERGGCVGGKLASYKVDEKKLILKKGTFNYDSYKKEKKLFKSLKPMRGEKLITSNVDHTGLLHIYKYTKPVFYKNLWHKNEFLTKMRGLVLDSAGDIVQHPFTKVFNYKENDIGLDIPDNKLVYEVEKLNGFLGCITKHPFIKNELLVTTTGSFNSDFVNYIKYFIGPKSKGKLLKYLSKNNLTLMFEVIHPEDPHIIKYENNMMGLHLIGARGKSEDDLELTEEELDVIGEELGLRRAKWSIKTFKEVRENVVKSQLEGFMVRDAENKEQKTLLKFKTPFYLTTKFIGRLSENNIKFMFSNVEAFKKQKLDEEFFVIADLIVEKFDVENFINFSKEKRTRVVRELILKEIS
jgi:predicted kinase